MDGTVLDAWGGWSKPNTETVERDMAQMHKPPHPGEVLKDTVLRAHGGISVTEFAKRLDVSRVALSRVLNGKAAVSAELAIRLAAALRGSAESWLHMQLAYDLWHARRKRRPKIEPLDPYLSTCRCVDRTKTASCRSSKNLKSHNIKNLF